MSSIVYINFHSVINESVVNKLMAVCVETVARIKPSALYFLFASPGGGVDPGIVLYNFLRALPCKVVMHNTGSIDSIATVIFHAADERYSSPHASFLFHGITWTFGQNQTVYRNQIDEIRSGIIEAENKISKIISERCRLSEDEIRSLFRQGETKNTAFAFEKGIIHEIREAKVPSDAQFLSFTM
jgi:ATP-dependent protease ClpP protease subunit